MTRKEEIDKNAHEHFAHGWKGSLIDAYIEGAEWADKTMLDKVCQWIEENYDLYEGVPSCFVAKILRKDMEG